MDLTSFAQKLSVNSAMPRLAVDMNEAINIGFLGPLSGSVESWGAPGLNGCQIWQDWVNEAGGLMIGGRRHPIIIRSFDCQYDPQKALEGAKFLCETHNIKLLLMLGGDTLRHVKEYVTERKILTSTLLPSDLSPDTPYLIAPSESHPIFNVTGVSWLAKAKPHCKTAALCSQIDELGIPSLATYRAAFRSSSIEILKQIQYSPYDTEVEPILAPLLATNPDILCLCTGYTPIIHSMVEFAFHRGFEGQIISCTLDQYEKLIKKTSIAFMEGFVFQFPDFDDKMLQEKSFFFNRPHVFYDQYNERFPNSWSAVSWEYVAILDIWHAAVEKVGGVNPVTILAAMKQLGQVSHAFGEAKWWGQELYGIDNALIGDWPVVEIRDGKAQIVEFGSVPEWIDNYGDLLKVEMEQLGQLWHQRLKHEQNQTKLGSR